MNDISQRIAALSPEQRALFELRLKHKGLSSVNSKSIPKRQDPSCFPLSFHQQRLWILHQLDPHSPVYNMPIAISFEGLLNVKALEQSLNLIQQRHEVLQTCFKTVGGQPVQEKVKVSDLMLRLPVIDLRKLSESERQQSVQYFAKEEARQPFDLSQGILLRVKLLQIAEAEHVLLFTMHHIICDAWSGDVIIRELTALYEAFCREKPSPLKELPIQYADFAVWQQQWLQGEILDTQLGYWKQHLDGAKTALLPTDQPHSQVESSAGRRHFFALSPTLSKSLKSLSQQQEVTLFMTLLAAFNTLLYWYTAQEDILVGSPVANRNFSEIEELIGFFVNTLVLRIDLSNNPSFRDLLQRVREVALAAYAHQDLPFERLVAELQPERNLNHTPLFQVWFVLHNTPISVLKFSGLKLSLVETESGMVRHDLKLDISETSEELKGFFEYKTNLFRATTIASMSELFEIILATVVAQPDIKLSQLVEILNEAEKQQQILKTQDFQTVRRHKLGQVTRKAITGNGQI
ncbi:MAG: condensation protein [Nostoc sp. NMS7]|uniref:condensation domain-containing protein n=1 Tax=Nostoc sp. NMS7 TaxID=2815391 RepID=UPI0025E75B3E|nr:condensation domain-containing protein [Nostoc sp. NMS7]MBN3951427.1 condensation protein [Nostoc sp. NMS7]